MGVVKGVWSNVEWGHLNVTCVGAHSVVLSGKTVLISEVSFTVEPLNKGHIVYRETVLTARGTLRCTQLW